MDTSKDDKDKIKEQIRLMSESKLKQQNLPAWRPIPNAINSCIIFSLFGTFFIAFGIKLYFES